MGRDYVKIAHQYCDDVLSGKILACQYVKLACQRHYNDLERSATDPSYPYEFNDSLAHRRCAFTEKLTHVKGKWSGQKIVLEPHQAFIQCAIWGWVERGTQLRRFKKVMLLIPRKNGKMLDLATPVPTPDGWSTMGDIKAGDIVFAPDGKQCRVTAVSDIDPSPESYLMVFSNGERVKACKDHQWVTTARVDSPGSRGGDRLRRWKPPSIHIREQGGVEHVYVRLWKRLVHVGKVDSPDVWSRATALCDEDLKDFPVGIDSLRRVRTTREIFSTQVYGKRKDRNHSMDMPSPIECGEADLPIDPYVLGAWLGDGTSSNADITCGIEDVSEMLDNLEACGVGCDIRSENSSRAFKITLYNSTKNIEAPGTGTVTNRSDIIGIMRDLNIIGNKHIPREYLRGSVAQRIALLQGLMDTDGTCDSMGRAQEFCTINSDIATGLCELLSTLGVKYSIREKYPICNGKQIDRVAYYIQFNCFRDIIPVFRLKRKLNRQNYSDHCRVANRSRTVQIVSVEPCDPVPMRCITVDHPSHQFLMGRTMLPTHNSVDAATAGLYGLVADGEHGGEVYSGATTEKQAMEVFRPAWQMVNANKNLMEHFDLSLSGTPRNPTSIYRMSDMSRFEPLVGNPGDGASPHYAIIDEFHEHRTSAQYDTMDTGMGARDQPMLFVVTTAGTDTSCPCYDLCLHSIKVLTGVLVDDALFAIIYTIDPDWDFKNFEYWKAANPNYGVSVKEDYLKRKYTEAMQQPEKQNINLCKHLNVWTNAGEGWMNMVKWEKCADPSLTLDKFKGQRCWAGLDLACKIDVCALVLLFRHEGGFAVFAKYYLPEETTQLAGNDHYDKWVKEGWITETPGGRTDFKYIEDDIEAINGDFPIGELAYDPRESTYLINNILEWASFPCVEIRQGPALMSEPMKEVEAQVTDGKLWHCGDPVLTWMMGNVVKKRGRSTGPVKYYYPTKEKDKNKIDGPVALIMAMSRAMLDDGSGQSAYDGLSVDEMVRRMTC